MAKSIGELVVNLTAETASFRRDLDTARKQVEHMGESVTGTFTRMASVVRTAMEVMGVAMVGEFVGKTIEAADAMGKMAQRAGVSVEAMSALGYAARIADLPIEDFAKSIQKMSKEMVAMAEGKGTKGAAEAFKALGIDVKDAGGKLRSSESVILDVAEKFSKMESSATKTGLAMQIFGRSGAQMIPFLNQGKEGITQLMQEAEKLGIVINEQTAKAAEQFEDNLKRLKTAAQGAANAVMVALLPALNRAAQAMADAGRQNASGAFMAIGASMKFVVNMASTVVAALRGVFDYFSQFADRFATVMILLSNGDFAGLKRFSEEVRKSSDLDPLKTAAIEIKGIWSGAFDAMGAEVKKVGDEFEPNFAAPAKKGVREVIDLLDKIPQSVAQMQAAIAAATPWTATIEQMKQLNELLKIGSDRYGKMDEDLNKAADSMREATVTTEEHIAAQKKLADQLLALGKISQETYDRYNKSLDDTLKKTTESTSKAKTLMAQFGEEAMQAFKGAALYGQGWGNVLKTLLIDMAELIIKMLIMKQIKKDMDDEDSSSGSGSSGSGGGGGLFGLLGGLFGHRAGGGPVSAGGSYIVGENGPELFTPKTSGTIIPNGASGGNVTYNIDARGAAPGVELNIMRALKQTEDRAVQRSVAAIGENKLRGAFAL